MGAGRWAGGTRAAIVVAVTGVAVVAALAGAALIPAARVPILAVLTLGYAASRSRGEPALAFAGVFSAALPVAAILAWGVVPQPVAGSGASQCADLFSPPAMYRMVELLFATGATALLLVDRRAPAASIGLRWGTRRAALVALGAFAVVGPAAVLLGSLLGGIFFGSFALDLSRPAAFIPALLFAGSNALAEELAYRGAMRSWLVPSLGVAGANLSQALIFGLAHTGGDFVGPAAPVVASMIGIGFVGGLIARRTGSLLVVVAVHAAADIPIYLYWACRVGP